MNLTTKLSVVKTASGIQVFDMNKKILSERTWCASDCQQDNCKAMLRYSVAKAAERHSITIKHADFSADCSDYLEPEKIDAE